MRFRLTISLLLWLPLAAAAGGRLLIQRSALAGSQFYAVETVRAELQVGAPLALVREPENRHDARAIRVEWRGQPLGYVPRRDNRVIAAAMDRGDRLVARISRLTASADPWQRLEFEVWAEW